MGSGDGGDGGGGSGGGGDGGNDTEEQHRTEERETRGDGWSGAAAAPGAAAAAPGEGALVATSLPASGDRPNFVDGRQAVGTREGVVVGAGAGRDSETAVEKSGCSPCLGADENKSAGERKEGQAIVAEENAAADDDVGFVGGNANSVTGSGSSGSGGGDRGSGGGGGGVSGVDGDKDGERETMPWWALFDARDEEIELVCSELLALYRTHDSKGGGKSIGGNGSIVRTGFRPEGDGGGSGADRGYTPSRRRDENGTESRAGVRVGDGSRVNGLGGEVGVRRIVDEVPSVSSANSSRRRNGSRQ